MSETPTPYDLTQDALIGPMRDILLTAAEPPSGPEFSYPVVDQAVSSSMWKWITRGMGSGILGEGGQPYWYRNVSNATNTAQIAVSTISGEAHAMIGGFFHHLSEPVTVSLPMPSSGTVTYHIALTYDPRRESDPEGPIKLETHTGALPTTFDREHIPLVTVTRRANELLTDADVQQHRPFVSPTVTYNWLSELPHPSTMLSGTVAIVRNDGQTLMSLQGNEPDEDDQTVATARWVNLSDPQWRDFSLYTSYERTSSSATPQIQRKGKTRKMRGAVRRIDGRPLSTGWAEGWNIGILPERDRPAGLHRQPVSGPGTAPGTIGAFDIGPDGLLRVYSTGPTMAWVSLHGVEWDVE